MKLKAILPVIIAASIQACGAAVLKSAASEKNILLIVIAMAIFGGGFSLYYRGLSQLKLFVAQPLFSSTMFLSATLISILYFKDSVTVHQISGIIGIIGGMVIMGTENQDQLAAGSKGAVPSVSEAVQPVSE